MPRLTDVAGRDLRFTEERLEQIERHPKMDGQLATIAESFTLRDGRRRKTPDDTGHHDDRRDAKTPATASPAAVGATT